MGGIGRNDGEKGGKEEELELMRGREMEDDEVRWKEEING
jgi:hypothetical protein